MATLIRRSLDWLAFCQLTVTGRDGNFDQKVFVGRMSDGPSRPAAGDQDVRGTVSAVSQAVKQVL